MQRGGPSGPLGHISTMACPRNPHKFVDHTAAKARVTRECVKYRKQYRLQAYKGTRSQARALATFKAGIVVWERWIDAWDSPTKPTPMWMPYPFDEGVLTVLVRLSRLLMGGLMAPWTRSQYYLDEFKTALVAPIARSCRVSDMSRLDKLHLLGLYKSVGLRYVHCLMSDALPRFRTVVFGI
jgi:hypothetical protein